MSTPCATVVRLVVAWSIGAWLLGLPHGVLALDYDRNDVLGREAGLIFVAGPEDASGLGVGVRGVARRHTRFLSLGLEVQAGVSTAPRPFLGVLALAGVESTSNGWETLRGYGEFGVGLRWASGEVRDLLQFHAEGGVRLLLQAFERPHTSVCAGIRIMSNFQALGWAALVGVAWTFD